MGSDASENPVFDHLLHAMPDLDAGIAAYRAAGLPARPAATMPGFRNAAWGIDERYVELLTVEDWEAVETALFAEGVARIRPAVEALRGPAGAITFAVDVTDARATGERLRAAGHEVAEVHVKVPGHDVSFVEVFVLDTPPWSPFFITYDPPREQLHAMRDPSRLDPGPHDLAEIVVTSPDPAGAAGRLANLLGLEADGVRVPLRGAAIVVEPGEHEEIVAVGLTNGPGREPVDVEGLSLRFRD